MSRMVRTLVMLMQKSSASVFATWNPSDKGSNVVLSNGDLTAEGMVAQQQVRSTLNKSSGKWYWEVTFSSGTNGLVGVASGTATINSSTGSEVVSVGYRANTGQVLQNASTLANFATYVAGDIIGVALDAGAGTITFYKNNALQGTVTPTSVGTPLHAAVGWGLGGLCIFTANFGASALVYSPPAGFNAGLYT